MMPIPLERVNPVWIYAEKQTELLIDNDRGLFTERNARAVLRSHANIVKILTLPSREHEHVVVLLDDVLDDWVRIALRGIMGDDRTRISIDLLNRKKLGEPSLLFTDRDWSAQWRKPDYPFSLDTLRELRPVRFGWAV
jgi:hypothetical protein